MIKLYSYWRSSAAYRVRIALNIKNIAHEIIPIHLVKDGGEQHKKDYRQLNPQGLVPTLIDGDITLTQSFSILEYLEEKIPSPAILPNNLHDRAFARQLAQIITSDTHPLNNLRVLQYLTDTLEISESQKNTWYRHWITEGLSSVEALLAVCRTSGPYCLGEQLSIADICLIPQLYNAHRYKIPLDDWPLLAQIETHCLQLDEFITAQPEKQVDAQQ